MKTIKIILLISFFFISLIALAFTDTTITSFYNSTNDSLGTSTNITFDQAESNVSVYLQFPKNSTVVNATLNVTGEFLGGTGTYTGWQFEWNPTSSSRGLDFNGTNFLVPEFQGEDAVDIHDLDGNWLWNFSVASEMTSLADVVSVGGSIYTIDNSGGIVYKYTSSGAYSGSSWNLTQEGGADISTMRGIDYNGTNYMVSDPITDQILLYDTSFVWVQTWSSASGDIPLNPLVLVWDGEYWLVSFGNDLVIRYDANMVSTGLNWTVDSPDSELISFIRGLAANDTYIWVSDDRNNKVNRFSNNFSYPSNVSIDTGNDSKNDYSMTGELNSTNSPQSVDLNITAIQNYVDTNTAAADGFVYVPMNVSSDKAGIVQFSSLSLNSTYNPPPNLSYISPTPGNDTTVNIDRVFVNVSASENVSAGLFEWEGTTNYTMGCTYINESFTFCYYNKTSITPDGTYTYRAYVNDTHGRLNATALRTVKIDTRAPPITITDPRNITYADTNISFNASSVDIDEDVWTFWITVSGGNVTDNITYTENENVSIKDYLSIDKTYVLYVWVNDTAGNENRSNVTFTINTTETIVYDPSTPPSDEGGGYTITPSFSFVADTTVEAFDPFTVEANVTIAGISSFSDPTIYIHRKNDEGVYVAYGTFGMVYRSGEGNSKVFWTTVDTLGPGNYTYYLEVLGSEGVYYYSKTNKIKVIEPLTRETTGETVLPKNMLVALISPPTPLSHESVSSKGFTVTARAYNLNGSVSEAYLFFLTTQGKYIANVSLKSSDSNNGSWVLHGQAVPPTGYTILTINVGVIDSAGNSATSVSRIIRIPAGDSDMPLAAGLDTISGTVGDSRGSPHKLFGKVFLGLIFVAMVVAAVVKSPLGVAGAVPLGIIAVIMQVQSGELPQFLGVLAVIATAIFAIGFLLKVIPKAAETV